MPPSKPTYITVKVPRALHDVIKDLIQENPDLGYTNPNGLITDAVRRRVEELKTLS